MSIEIKIDPKEINAKDLFEVYKKYCQAYKLDLAIFASDRDKLQLGMELERLEDWCIDYRPFMGAKFFAQSSSDRVSFWGYTSDEKQEKESQEFNNLVKEYFEKR